MIYVGFVGHEQKTWEVWAKRRCYNLAQAKSRVQAQTLYLLEKHAKKTVYNFDHAHYEEQFDYSDVCFVSGGCKKGGTDIWSEEIARQVLPKENIIIIPPDIEQWEDKPIYAESEGGGIKYHIETQIGYKSRNILIAKRCDYLYCIVPYMIGGLCYHHNGNKVIPHLKSGGCFTLKEYIKMGKKEGHLVVIR